MLLITPLSTTLSHRLLQLIMWPARLIAGMLHMRTPSGAAAGPPAGAPSGAIKEVVDLQQKSDAQHGDRVRKACARGSRNKRDRR